MIWPILGDRELNEAAIHRIMKSPDDIVVAVVGGVMLEEAVERTLKERMRANNKVQERLFDITKPLSSVSAQIDVLYMLWAIEPDVRNVMLNMCRIRNRFAHNQGMTFDSSDEKLKEALHELVLHEQLTFYPDARFGIQTSIPIKKPTSNREKFIVNLQLCLNYLMQDRCRHKAHSTTPISHEELEKGVGPPTS